MMFIDRLNKLLKKAGMPPTTWDMRPGTPHTEAYYALGTLERVYYGCSLTNFSAALASRLRGLEQYEVFLAPQTHPYFWLGRFAD